MELEGLAEIAMGERAEGAGEAAKGAFYAEGLVQGAAVRPFEAKEIKSAVVQFEEQGGNHDGGAEQEYYGMKHRLGLIIGRSLFVGVGLTHDWPLVLRVLRLWLLLGLRALSKDGPISKGEYEWDDYVCNWHEG